MNKPLSLEERQELCYAAQEVAKFAYAPYSKFRVGAAIFTESGLIYTGANVENASYGLSLCAERAAFAKAISEGEREFRGIAVACIDATGTDQNIQEFLPCGACRQWMVEFATDAEIVICGTDRIFRVDALMPMPFQLGRQ